MADREKVISWVEGLAEDDWRLFHSDSEVQNIAIEVLALLKEQEGIINELLDLGYPHNFQHEAPWVVDYLYKLTEIIKKAFKARKGR